MSPKEPPQPTPQPLTSPSPPQQPTQEPTQEPTQQPTQQPPPHTTPSTSSPTTPPTPPPPPSPTPPQTQTQTQPPQKTTTDYLLSWTSPNPHTGRPRLKPPIPLPTPQALRAALATLPSPGGLAVPELFRDVADDPGRRVVVLHGLGIGMVGAVGEGGGVDWGDGDGDREGGGGSGAGAGAGEGGEVDEGGGEGGESERVSEEDGGEEEGKEGRGRYGDSNSDQSGEQDEQERGRTALGVDPQFVACLAQRRPYRLRGRGLAEHAERRRMWRESMQARQDLGRYDFGGYVWEYPEVVEVEGDCSALIERAGVEIPGELGVGPTVMPLGGEGTRKIAVVFCRVGLWRGPMGYVLFLDREVWDVPGEGVRKARRVTARKVEGPEQVTESLEEVFLDAVEENWNADDQLPGIVSEVVYRHWQELFDFLEPEPRATREETVACYRRMVRLLELNDEKSDDMNWKRLVDRIVIRLNWLKSASDHSPVPPSTTLWATPPAITTSKHGTAARDNRVRSSSEHGQAPQRRVDENQRALDRLSYLGGILIPLPIISSILSMGDTYGPDGSRFFIFWALSVPLAGLTVLLIYADTIRKAEVWVEIEPGLVMPNPGGKATGSRSHDEGMGSGAEVPHNRILMGRRRRTHEDGEQPLPGMPDSVPFVVDHDVEEKIIDMPTASAPSTQPQTGHEEVVDRVHQRRWSMGWVQVPMLILEKPVDGSRPKAWKRKQLGWTGAIRVILYKKFRDGDDIPDGVAACEKPRRGKTKTF